MTFEFCGIQDGDSIVALPLETHEADLDASTWINRTQDKEAFNKSVH
jgi:hypothetical protein